MPSTISKQPQRRLLIVQFVVITILVGFSMSLSGDARDQTLLAVGLLSIVASYAVGNRGSSPLLVLAAVGVPQLLAYLSFFGSSEDAPFALIGLFQCALLIGAAYAAALFGQDRAQRTA